MSQIFENLYLGDIDTAKQNQEKEIKIINCAKEITDTRFDYKIDLYDGKNDLNFTQEMDNVVKVIDDFLSSDKIVLVHCSAGVSRSASVVIYYLIKYKNYKFSNALIYVQSKRPSININRWFYNWFLKNKN
jgi:protein-tyrosine phosphatase